jgi:hypothetical protein
MILIQGLLVIHVGDSDGKINLMRWDWVWIAMSYGVIIIVLNGVVAASFSYW